MEWYYNDNKLKQFYGFYTKYFAEIAQKQWNMLLPEDYDGCYMSTAMEIDENTRNILKYSFEHNINPNYEYEKRRKIEFMNKKIVSINEEFGNIQTFTWKDLLRCSVRAYDAQEEIFWNIFEKYCEQNKK